MKRIMFGLVAGIVLLIIGGALWITRVRAYEIVHPGRGTITRAPESVGITNYQNVTFKSADGLTLKGWWVPPQNGATIILVHGHGGTRQGQLDDAGILAGRGYGALLFDLRNSGESEGTVTTFGLLEVNDVRGGIDFALAQPGVDPQRIGLLGQSMGGATVIMAAARIPEVRAVAALSAYTSMEDNIETGVENLAGLPSFPFAPLVIFWGELEASIDIQQVAPAAEIASISPRPILIVHGERDDLIPVENAHALYAAAREPKELFLIPEAAHESFYPVTGEAYAQKLAAFFDQYLRGE
jgi:fermentation-respiration switch protein FrsA (DUF1100 family)